jgi:hypothetical protein
MFNGTLHEFVCDVIAKGQIGYGDVRRLQRDYLPGGITSRDQLELLISLNERLVRADKAWGLWLVAVVTEFVVKREVCEHPVDEAAGEWVTRLLAASTTSLSRKIARQVRRGLDRRHGTQSMSSKRPHLKGVQRQQPSQAAAPENDLDNCSLRITKPPRCAADESPDRSGPVRCTDRHQMIQGTLILASAAHGWCLAGYLPAVRRTHVMNFSDSRVSLAFAPCR